MKQTLLITLTLALTLPIYAQEKDDASSDKKKPDPQAVFAKKDTDKDGFLSKEEFTTGAKDATKAETTFTKKDKNNDGKLSPEEFASKAKKGGAEKSES
jgi:Ca2+-binding EF-hand superfamily protein